jgi:large subunit ribosomal protein L4
LSAKTGAGEVVVLELALAEAKTKHAAAAMKALGLAQQSVLLVVAEKDPTVVRSFANLPKVKMLLSSYLNVRDLLGHDVLVLAKDAVTQVESWLGADVSQENGSAEAAEPAAYAGAAGAATSAATEE